MSPALILVTSATTGDGFREYQQKTIHSTLLIRKCRNGKYSLFLDWNIMFMTKMFFGNNLWHRWLTRKNHFLNRPWWFKCWIELSTRQITVQGIKIREFNCTILWIEIYPMDSTIHLLKNWGLVLLQLLYRWAATKETHNTRVETIIIEISQNTDHWRLLTVHEVYEEEVWKRWRFPDRRSY